MVIVEMIALLLRKEEQEGPCALTMDKLV